MATYNALMQIKVDTSDANKKLSEVERGISSIDSSSRESSSSLKRLEGTFARIEKSMKSVERILKSVDRALRLVIRSSTSFSTGLGNIDRSLGTTNKTLNRFAGNIGNISKKYDKLARENKKLTQQLNDLKKAASGAAPAIEKASKGKLTLMERAKKANKELEAMGFEFEQLTIAALNFIAVGVIAYFIKLSDQLILLKNRLTTVNFETNKVNQAFKDVYHIAQQTRTSLSAVANLYSRIGRNSKELAADTSRLNTVVRAINQSFQLSGATAEEARNAIVQLSQAFASGRLQGDELRSMLELAPTASKKMAQAIGITTGVMRKFAAEGLITAKVMSAAFEKAAPEIQKEFDQIRGTISQAMEQIRNSIMFLVGTTPAFEQANQNLVVSLQKVSVAISGLKGPAEVVGVVLKGLANMLPAFVIGLTSLGTVLGLVALKFAAVKIAIGIGMLPVFGQIALAVGATAAVLEGLYNVLNDGESLFFGLIATATGLKDSLESVDSITKRLENSFKDANERAAEFDKEIRKNTISLTALKTELNETVHEIQSLEYEMKTMSGFDKRLDYLYELVGFGNKRALSKLKSEEDKLEKRIQEIEARGKALQREADKARGKKEGKKAIEDPQKLLLDSLTSVSKAVRQRTDLIAEISRNRFEKAFDKPLDLRFSVAQDSLDTFAKNFSKDIIDTFKKYVPEGVPFIDKNLLIKDSESLIKGLRSALQNSFKDLQEGDLGFDLSAILESVKKNIGEILAPDQSPALGQILDAVLSDKFKARMVTLLSDMKEYKLQQLIVFENEKRRADESFKAEGAIQRRLELERELLKNNEGIDSSAKEYNSNLEIQKKLIGANRVEAIRLMNVDAERNNYSVEQISNLTEIINKTFDLKKSQEELNLALETQKEIIETRKDIEDQEVEIKFLQDQLKFIKEGSSAYGALVKATKEQQIQERKIQRARDKANGILTEQIDIREQLLIQQQTQLNRERDISEELRIQNDIRNKERNLVLKTAVQDEKLRLEKEKQQLGFFEQIDLHLEEVLTGTNRFDRRIKSLEKSLRDVNLFGDLSPDAFKMEGDRFVLDRNSETIQKMSETELKLLDLREKSYNLSTKIYEQEQRRQNLGKGKSLSQYAVGEIGGGPFGDSFLSFFRSLFSSKKTGGLLSGKSHSQGGIKAVSGSGLLELEGGEYIISKDAVSKYGVGIFDALNAKKMQSGGMDPYYIGNKALAAGDMKGYQKAQAMIQQQVAQKRTEDFARRGVPTFDTKGYVTYANEAGEVTKELVSEFRKARNIVEENNEVVKEQTKSYEVSSVVATDGLNLFREQFKKLPSVQEQATAAIAKVTEKFKDVGRTLDELSEAERTALFAGEESPFSPFTETNTAGQPTPDMKKGIGRGAAQSEGGILKALGGGALLALSGGLLGAGDIAGGFQDLLNQNEKFNKVRQKFEEAMMKVLNGLLDGIAIVADVIYDVLSPVLPLLDMIGSFIRDLLRSFTQIFDPFYELLELLKPVLIYLSGFLQVIVGVFNFFFGAINDLLSGFLNSILGPMGLGTGDEYKSLNLLRSEAEVLGKIENSLEGVVDVLQDIDDIVYEITSSTLNLAAPTIKIEDATQRYNELFDAATRITAEEADVTAFTSFAQEYLQLSQDLYKSSGVYQGIYDKVLGDIDSIKNEFEQDIGSEITDVIRRAVYDLALVGSDLDVYLNNLVEQYQNQVIDYNQFVDTIAFKLGQVEEDIQLKQFADFGQVSGGNMGELLDSYSDFVERELDRFNQSRDDAISASTLAEDLAYLYGVGTEQVGIVEEVINNNSRTRRGVNPNIGDIGDPGIDVDRGEGSGASLFEGFNLDFGSLDLANILAGILGPIGEVIERIVLNIEQSWKDLWSELELFWDALTVEWNNLYKGLQTTFSDFESWLSSLGEIDLQAEYTDLVSDLGLPDLSDFDLQADIESWWPDLVKKATPNLEQFGLSGNLETWFTGLQSKLTPNLDQFSIDGNISTLFSGLISKLTPDLSDLDLDLSGLDFVQPLQTAVNNFFNLAKRPAEAIIKLLPNPFKQFIGGSSHLLEFQQGGMIQGPSHKNGGVKALVKSSNIPVELEGGEYIIKKATASRLGKNLLDRINQGDVPRYDNGGQIIDFYDRDRQGFATNNPVTGSFYGKSTGSGGGRANPNDTSYMISQDRINHQSQNLNLRNSPGSLASNPFRMTEVQLVDFNLSVPGFIKDLLEMFGLPHGAFFNAVFPHTVEGGLHFESGGMIPFKKGDNTYSRNPNVENFAFAYGNKSNAGSASFGVSAKNNLTGVIFGAQGGAGDFLKEGFLQIWGTLLESVNKVGDFFYGPSPTDTYDRGYGPLGVMTELARSRSEATDKVYGMDYVDYESNVLKSTVAALAIKALLGFIGNERSFSREVRSGAINSNYVLTTFMSLGTNEMLRKQGFGKSVIGEASYGTSLLLPALLLIAANMNREKSPEKQGDKYQEERLIDYNDWYGSNYAKGGIIPSYAKGGLAVGPSHSSGMLGMSPSGGPFMFEGGEYIINKKTTKKLGLNYLNSLNSFEEGGDISDARRRSLFFDSALLALLGAGLGGVIGSSVGMGTVQDLFMSALPYTSIAGGLIFLGGAYPDIYHRIPFLAERDTSYQDEDKRIPDQGDDSGGGSSNPFKKYNKMINFAKSLSGVNSYYPRTSYRDHLDLAFSGRDPLNFGQTFGKDFYDANGSQFWFLLPDLIEKGLESVAVVGLMDSLFGSINPNYLTTALGKTETGASIGVFNLISSSIKDYTDDYFRTLGDSDPNTGNFRAKVKNIVDNFFAENYPDIYSSPFADPTGFPGLESGGLLKMFEEGGSTGYQPKSSFGQMVAGFFDAFLFPGMHERKIDGEKRTKASFYGHQAGLLGGSIALLTGIPGLFQGGPAQLYKGFTGKSKAIMGRSRYPWVAATLGQIGVNSKSRGYDLFMGSIKTALGLLGTSMYLEGVEKNIKDWYEEPLKEQEKGVGFDPEDNRLLPQSFFPGGRAELYNDYLGTSQPLDQELKTRFNKIVGGTGASGMRYNIIDGLYEKIGTKFPRSSYASSAYNTANIAKEIMFGNDSDLHAFPLGDLILMNSSSLDSGDRNISNWFPYADDGTGHAEYKNFNTYLTRGILSSRYGTAFRFALDSVSRQNGILTRPRKYDSMILAAYGLYNNSELSGPANRKTISNFARQLTYTDEISSLRSSTQGNIKDYLGKYKSLYNQTPFSQLPSGEYRNKYFYGKDGSWDKTQKENLLIHILESIKTNSDGSNYTSSVVSAFTASGSPIPYVKNSSGFTKLNPYRLDTSLKLKGYDGKDYSLSEVLRHSSLTNSFPDGIWMDYLYPSFYKNSPGYNSKLSDQDDFQLTQFGLGGIIDNVLGLGKTAIDQAGSLFPNINSDDLGINSQGMSILPSIQGLFNILDFIRFLTEGALEKTEENLTNYASDIESGDPLSAPLRFAEYVLSGEILDDITFGNIFGIAAGKYLYNYYNKHVSRMKPVHPFFKNELFQRGVVDKEEALNLKYVWGSDDFVDGGILERIFNRGILAMGIGDSMFFMNSYKGYTDFDHPESYKNAYWTLNDFTGGHFPYVFWDEQDNLKSGKPVSYEEAAHVNQYKRFGSSMKERIENYAGYYVDNVSEMESEAKEFRTRLFLPFSAPNSYRDDGDGLIYPYKVADLFGNYTPFQKQILGSSGKSGMDQLIEYAMWGDPYNLPEANLRYYLETLRASNTTDPRTNFYDGRYPYTKTVPPFGKLTIPYALPGLLFSSKRDRKIYDIPATRQYINSGIKSFGKGGLAVGPSHQSGMLGMTKSGSPFLFEGGEYIVNKKTVGKLGTSFFDRINSYENGGSPDTGSPILDYYELFGGMPFIDESGNRMGGEQRVISFLGPQPVFLETGTSAGNPVSVMDLGPVAQFKFLELVGQGVYSGYSRARLEITKAIADYETEKTGTAIQVGLGAYLGGQGMVVPGLEGIAGQLAGGYLSGRSATGGRTPEQIYSDRASQPPIVPRATGGMLYGPSHAKGGILLNAEGGEYVINKNAVMKYGGALFDNLNSMNMPMFQNGGYNPQVGNLARYDIDPNMMSGSTAGSLATSANIGTDASGNPIMATQSLLPAAQFGSKFTGTDAFDNISEGITSIVDGEEKKIYGGFKTGFTHVADFSEAFALAAQTGFLGGGGGGGISNMFTVLENMLYQAVNQALSNDFIGAAIELMEYPADTLRKWRTQLTENWDPIWTQDFIKAAEQLITYPADTLREWRDQYMPGIKNEKVEEFVKFNEEIYTKLVENLQNAALDLLKGLDVVLKSITGILPDISGGLIPNPLAEGRLGRFIPGLPSHIKSRENLIEWNIKGGAFGGGESDSKEDGGYLSYNKGGMAIGPSHAQGGIAGVVGRDRYPIEFEGGEYIINKRTVDYLGTEFFNSVNSVNDPKTANAFLAAGNPNPSSTMAAAGLDTYNLMRNGGPSIGVGIGGSPGAILRHFGFPTGAQLNFPVFGGPGYNPGRIFAEGGRLALSDFPLLDVKLKVPTGLGRGLGLGKFFEEGGETPEKFFLGRVTRAIKRVLKMPTLDAKMGVSLLNGPYASTGFRYENGGLVGSFENGGSLSSQNLGFHLVSEVNTSSQLNASLLRELIIVLRNKDLSVTIVDENGNENDESNLVIQRSNELNYRNAVELA